MWRVLKLTAAIMGITLLTLTPLIQDARTPPEILPIIHIVNYYPEEGTSEVGETVQYWPIAPRNFIINRRGLNGRFWYIAPSLDWAMGASGSRSEGLTNFYRIATTHAVFQPIIQGAVSDQTVFLPYFEGMIYTTANSDGSFDYWVWYYPSNTHWRINDLVQPYDSPEGLPEPLFWDDGRGVLSLDGRWLYLVQREPDGPYHIMAISVTDKTITNLTADQTLSEMPHLRTVFDEWLVFRLGTRLHRLRRDGTGFGLLINDAWQPADPTMVEWSLREFEAWDVIMVARDDKLVGVRVTTGEVLWEAGTDLQDVWYTRSTPFTVDGWLRTSSGKFNLLSGEFVSLPGRNYQLERLSSDGTQLFYIEKNPTTGENDLWHEAILMDAKQLIRSNIGDVESIYVAPDSEHLVLGIDRRLDYVTVATGATRSLFETPVFSTTVFDVAGWMHRFEFAWQPSRLLVVAVTLITLSMVTRPLLQLLHRNPSSFRGH